MANLSVTISENLNLNGNNRGSTNTVSVSNVTQCANEIKTCISNKRTVLGNFGSITNSVKYSQFNFNDAKYVRVTNLSTEYAIEIAFASIGADDICTAEGKTTDSYRVLLQAGQSTMLWDADAGKLGASTAPVWTDALSNLSYVEVNNTTAHNIDVEFFVASSTAVEDQ